MQHKSKKNLKYDPLCNHAVKKILNLIQRGLTDISLLKNYIHLRFIDLSNNNLKDISALNGLLHVLTLKCDSNKLTSAKLDPMPYLQMASFSDNEIKSTQGICHPKLESLNLNSKISTFIIYLF